MINNWSDLYNSKLDFNCDHFVKNNNLKPDRELESRFLLESTKLLKSKVTQIQFNSVQWEQIHKIAINFIRYFSALSNVRIAVNPAL
ncbi:hypothetical protein VCR26J2_170062 [Vibrio coralliirubri]|nr:hypothetical protein VCR26J2_170062 [Vibrio coralliirubri]